MTTKKETNAIANNTELFGALVELDYTKKMLESHLEESLFQVKETKKAIRLTKKRFAAGVVIYEKTHGKFKMTKDK